MNIRFHLSLIALFICYVSSFSQVENHISWGGCNKHSMDDHESKIIGYDGSHFYSVNTVAGFEPKVILKKLDSNFKVVQSKILSWNGSKKRCEFWSIMLVNDRLVLFESENNQKNKTSTLYLKTVNKESLEVSTSEVKITEVFYDEKLLSHYYFKFKKFEDKVLVRSYPTTKEQKRVELRAIDFNGRTVWKNSITKEKVYADTFDENNGYHFIQKSEGSDFFTLNSLLENGTQWIERRVPHQDKMINRYELLINESGNIVCTGLFLKKSTYKSANYNKISGDLVGTYWYEFDHKTDHLLTENTDTLSNEFREEVSTLVTRCRNKEISKKDKRSFSYAGSTKRRYSINDDNKWNVDFEVDHVVYLPANQRKSVLKTDRGHLITTIQSFTFLSNATQINCSHRILLVHLSHDGQLLWSTSIPFYQYDNGENEMKLMGFDLVKYDENLHLIFNNHKRNLKDKKTLHPFSLCR